MSVSLPQGTYNDPIPHRIIQTWKTQQVPDHLVPLQKTWIDFHPHWEYQLTTDTDNEQFIEEHYPWFLPYYKSYPHSIQRVDAVRYFYMYHYGGVYADLDMQCLSPFDQLVDNARGVVLGQEGQQHRNGTQRCGNAILISAPHHPFWIQVFQALMERHGKSNPDKIGSVFDTTGPSFLHEVYLKAPQGVNVLPKTMFYPMPWKEPSNELTLVNRKMFPQSWAVHHWSGAWRNSPRQVRFEVSLPKMADPMEFYVILPRTKRNGWGVIETALAQGHLYQQTLLETWINLLEPHDSAVLVGPYNGYLLVPLAKYLKDGVVYCFEANREARELLVEAIRVNRLENVRVYDQMAYAQTCVLYRNAKPNPLKPHHVIWRPEITGFETTMATQLDLLLTEPQIKLIHISACTEEYMVLQGAVGLLYRDHPLLTIDVWPDQKRSQYHARVHQDQTLAYLGQLGYDMTVVESSVLLGFPNQPVQQ